MARWLEPPEELVLENGEAHVWKRSLETLDMSFWDVLSDEETDRARRFRFQRHRDRFATSRAVLRLLLGRYLGVHPHEVAFRYSDKGKPSVVDNPLDLRFNVAHSHDLAIYAFTRGVEIGVDVEMIREGPAEERIPERFFSGRETEAIRGLPAEQQREAFFRCWTRKEAFLKATGKGITFGLDQFCVSVAPGEPSRLVETFYEPDEAASWSIYEIEPGWPYLGALALRGRLRRLHYWNADFANSN